MTGKEKLTEFNIDDDKLAAALDAAAANGDNIELSDCMLICVTPNFEIDITHHESLNNLARDIKYQLLSEEDWSIRHVVVRGKKIEYDIDVTLHIEE